MVAGCKSSLWMFLGETRILFFAGMTLRFHCRGGEIGIIKVRAKQDIIRNLYVHLTSVRNILLRYNYNYATIYHHYRCH